AHQPDVAFLDEIQQGQALALVLPGHGHHQSQVGHDEPLACRLRLSDVGTGLRDALLRTEAAGAEAILGLLAALDGHGKLHLFLLGEQRLARRSLQVEAEIISVVGPQGTRRLGHFVSRSSSRPGPPHSAAHLIIENSCHPSRAALALVWADARRANALAARFHGRWWSYVCKAQPACAGVEVV